MSPHRQTRPRLYAALLALCFLPGLGIVLSIPWLKQQPDDLVFLLSGVAAAVTIFASLALAILHDQYMDEWQRSNSRFSTFWGDATGTSLIALLLAVPAFRDWIVALVADWADAPDANAKLVIITFVSGFMAVVIARITFTVFLSIGWTFWKSRGAHEA